MAVALLATLLMATGCGGTNSGSDDASSLSNDPLETITGEELYRRGMLLARAGDYVRAEQYLAASIDRGFTEERALPALLNVCIRASRLVAALEYAEPYLARHPEQWQLRLLVGTIHMGLSQPERARTQLERVLVDAAPQDPSEAHYFLGVVFRDSLGDEESAAAHFRRYLVLEPEGSHAEEARAAMTPAERGLPTRVERDDVPPPQSTEGATEDAATQDAATQDAATESPETEATEVTPAGEEVSS